MIAIVDYGMGNIHSVNKALQISGAKTIIINKPADIQLCDKLVLPGVGAFDDAILELKKQRLIKALLAHIKLKKPFLGICLGMQILFEVSEEAAQAKGLGVLKGVVKRFQSHKDLKVPHIGWNQIKTVNLPINSAVQRKSKKCPLLKDIPNGSYAYFCHSYYPEPEDKNVIAALTDYGINFASCVWKDNVYGVQFHPEKSQIIGLKILENFVNLC
ncbi:MAG: imidazole glycerol phosphate synthase subunit HisH [Candidatus Omnitrophota bacterium]|nr:imidazole glycerol phosphate synthase subunit HisH [Candidatus Omnitrophota bacterium]